MIAGSRGRQQRARLRIELAEAQEVAGETRWQDGEIALDVAGSNPGGLALEFAGAGGEARVPAGPRENRRFSGHGRNGHGARFPVSQSSAARQQAAAGGFSAFSLRFVRRSRYSRRRTTRGPSYHRGPGKTRLNMAAGSVLLPASNNLTTQQVQHNFWRGSRDG